MILVVNNQQIYNYDNDDPPIADRSINFVRIEFRLSSEWDGYTCIAQFYQNGNTYNKLLDKDNAVMLPSELTEGQVRISIFGEKPGEPDRATSIPYIKDIVKSGFLSNGKTPIPPTPDLYAQLLKEFKQQIVPEEAVAISVDKYLKENPVEVKIDPATTESIGGIIVGEGLTVTNDGTLSVDVTESVEKDNTKPITSAAVYVEVGNINALLATI